MDSNNWRPPQSDAQPPQPVDGADWRSQVQPESRQRIVNQIMETLKQHPSFPGQEGLQGLKQISIRFEEEIYSGATSQSDYLQKITLRLLAMETQSQRALPNAVLANSDGVSRNPQDSVASQNLQTQVHNQGQFVPLQMVPNQSQARQQISSQDTRNNVSSGGMQTTIALPNTIPTNGLAQNPVPILAQNLNLQNISGISQSSMGNTVNQGITSNVFSNAQRKIQGRQQLVVSSQHPRQNSHQYMYQQQLLEQKLQQQSAQQPMMQTSSVMQPSVISGLQQNQKQSSIQQPTLSVLQQHQQSVNRQQQQHQQCQQVPNMQQQQQQSQQVSGTNPGNMQQSQLIDQQRNSGIVQQGQLIGQQPNAENTQQIQLIGQLPNSASLGSTAQTSSANGGDWQEEVYQKIKSMKDLYYSDLNEMRQQIYIKLQQHDSLPQQPKIDQIEKVRAFKHTLEQLMQALQITKNSILPSHGEKLPLFEKRIVSLLNSHRPRKPVPSAQVIHPQLQPLSQPRSQLPQVHDSGVNCQLQSVNPQHGSVSSLCANPSSQQKIPSSIQQTPNLDPGKANAPSSTQQGAVSALPQNPGTLVNASATVSGKSSVTEQPNERFLRAVKSISPKALSSAVSDISSVVSMLDRIAESAPGNGSRAMVGEVLVAMTKCRLQAGNFHSEDGSSGIKRMRRYTSAIPLNVGASAGSVNDSLMQLKGADTPELESTATSGVKKARIEINHALMEEIREINERLIDTVVDISNEDMDPFMAAPAAEGGEGTVVKCSYSAITLSPSLRSQYMSAQMSPIQPLKLLVPANYPNCSPILLDKLPVGVGNEHEDLSVKTKSRFSISLRCLSQPMSLKDIARTWDACARAVISEYVQQFWGGTFSSKYGTWEICLSTA